MGLKEKRAAKNFEETKFPELKEGINTAAGFDVEMDVQWDKLATDGQDHLYDENWGQLYFLPIKNAFAEICQDDMGKEALKETLKKVVVTNEKDAYSPHSAITFEEGVLHFDHSLSNVGQDKERATYIVELLSKAM